jgi:protein-S-isoprenylcysteine O-methyltransferase Ste14
MRVRRLVEATIAGLPLLLQPILYSGGSISVMFIPLVFYLASLKVFSPYVGWDIYINLFIPSFVLGRTIDAIGLLVWAVAAVQFLRSRGRLAKTGLYSVVRHPQYLGIIMTTCGATIMVLQNGGPQPVALVFWLIEALGYILLACHEERYVLREKGIEYEDYRDKVPCNPILPPSLSYVASLAEDRAPGQSSIQQRYEHKETDAFRPK